MPAAETIPYDQSVADYGGESKQDNQLTVSMSRAEAHEAEWRMAHIHLDQLQKAAAKARGHASH